MINRYVLKANGRGRSRLNFFVDDIGDLEVVDEAVVGTGRRILRRGSSYLYALNGINDSDRKIMETAKSALIGRIACKPGVVSKQQFAEAMGIAYGEALMQAGEEKAHYLSYLVAHDTLGSGPLGVLAEDTENIEEIEIGSASSPLSVYTTRYGKCATNLRFADDNAFRQSIDRFILESEAGTGKEDIDVKMKVGRAVPHGRIRLHALTGAAASICLKRSATLLSGMAERGVASAELLAYLWLAVDAGMNMLIVGTDEGGKRAMLGAIAELLPRFSRLVTVQNKAEELRFTVPLFNVFSTFNSRYGRSSINSQISNALQIRPDRVIVDGICGTEARTLFAGASSGIGFIATMRRDKGDAEIIKRLLARQMAVEPRDISMLDASLHITRTDRGALTISEVDEYRWLSKGETGGGRRVDGGDSVSTGKIAAMGHISVDAILHSKAYARIAELNGLSVENGRMELTRRIDCLKKMHLLARDRA